ncbi:MAG: hypothetical protein ACD_20C00097G0033 [uncultured bacterium]|nr:MAG: hypothetical protein ACD_20C00097G0033 [uncultured bacterium]
MKKNILNKLTKVFFILSLLIFIGGCAKKEEKTVIQFSSWGSESEITIIKPILKEFERINPDIKVDFVHIPKNYFQKLHLLVASHLAPDVVFLNNINGPVYAENDILLDLSDYLKKDELTSENDFFPQSLEAFKYKNTLYAIPRDISNLVIYYNKDIFDKYNVPYPDKNWDYNKFLSVTRKLTKDFNNDGKIDQFGVGFEEKSLFWLPFLWSNSGGIISSDLKTTKINNPESIDSIQYYADLRNKYHVAPTASETGSATMSQLFMQGKIAMQINGRWGVPRYRKDLDFNWDIARFPKGSAGSIVDADASGWAISKSSRHPEEAWRLIRFLAGKHSSQEFTKSGLIVPARVDVANSDVFLDEGQLPKNSRLFIDIIPESKPTPVVENQQEIMDLIDISLESVWDGKKKAADVLDDKLVGRINKLLH